MTAAESLADALARIAACADPAVVISRVDPGWLAERAAEIDARPPGEVPLRGTTFAVKDNIDVIGTPTTAACPPATYLAARSATVVERLITAGALPVVKANLDQFATGLVGTRSPYGTPQNPIAPQLVPGGSSSGSAVAVALGLVDFALGTDTAGSGRVPAGMCGIVGIKPTPGWLSTSGVIPAVHSVDCVSVFARQLASGWRAVEAAAGFDATDPFARRAGVGVGAIRRVGVVAERTLVELGVEPGVIAGYTASIEEIATAGFELIEFDPAVLWAIGDQLYGGPWVSERLSTITGFDLDERQLEPTVASIISGARRYTALDVHTARAQVGLLRHHVDALFERIDAIALPTIGWHVTLDEVAADPLGPNTRLGRFTTFTNLAGLAAVTVPVRSDHDVATFPPFSLSLHAPAWSDGALVAAVARIVGATPFCSIPDGSLLLAVAGAHLRGEALDHQLTDRGATFVATTTTAATYRMMAIADSVPPKPALVHVGDGGEAIEVDLWTLTPAALGTFVASIPPPLGIGTIDLADGRQVTGFIAEPRACDGALDITSYGGWRAYRRAAG